MATRKKVTRKATRTAASKLNIIESGQHIWLAGLGALARTQREGPKLFQSLVAEGAKLQARTTKATEQAVKNTLTTIQEAVATRVGNAKDKAQETWDNIEGIFQSRVQKAIHELGVPSAREIHILMRKVEALTESVEHLSKLQAQASRSSKTPRAKAVAAHAAHSASTGGPVA